MDADAPGLWLLPSKGRVASKLPRFLAQAIASKISTPGAILVQEEEYAAEHEAYDCLALPDGWTVHPVKAGCTGEATERGWRELCPDAQWIGWLTDDLMPRTQGWDRRLLSALNGYNVVSTDYGPQLPKRLNGAIAFSGDLIRAVGYIYPPGLKHLFIDSAWEDLGRLTGCWSFASDIMVEHAHAEFDGSADATTKKVNSFWPNDERAFMRWKTQDASKAAERIMGLMESYGLKMTTWDFSGVNITIATPCGDGKLERVYVESLLGTMAFIRQFGGEVGWATLPYCSDIALARNKLFGGFLRSSATHLLFIDADQGFAPQDIGRMIAGNKDIMAVAGVRKVFPLSFAVNVSDDQGRPIPIRLDPETGFLEVTGIGMACALLSRHACERMAQTYADLAFTGPDGKEELGVFNPLIVHGRYLAEDFAFCHRWRALGGKIFCPPDVSIPHVGSYTWTGSWAEQLRDISQKQVA